MLIGTTMSTMKPPKTASWGVGRVTAEAEARFVAGVDVLDLIRSAELPERLADDLHPWVRDEFKELWNAAQGEDPY